MNIKDATGRLARWALLLQQYNFEIIHRPGCQNGNADALSRRPYPGRQQNAEPYSMEYPMEYLKWSTPKNHVLVK